MFIAEEIEISAPISIVWAVFSKVEEWDEEYRLPELSPDRGRGNGAGSLFLLRG